MTCLQEEFEALGGLESGSEMEFGRGEGGGEETLPTAEVTECIYHTLYLKIVRNSKIRHCF